MSFLALCVLNSFLSCTAFLFNIVTINAIKKTSSLSKNLKTLLLNLAISDLGVGLLAQPMYVTQLIMKWKQHNENDSLYTGISNAHLILTNIFAPVTFYVLAVLCVERFMAIRLPLRYQELVTHKRIATAVFSIWALSGLFSLLRLWTPKIIMYGFFALFACLCYMAATWFSVRIVLLVRKQINVIHVLQGPQVAQSGQMAHVIRLRKFAIASVYLYVIFLVCYLPNTCVLFAIASNGPSTSLRHLQLFTMTLVFLNSTLNPLIYCWKMKNIRHTVVDMLRHTFSSFSRPTEESWIISTMH